MKKLIWIIVIAIVIVLGIVWMNGNNSDISENTETNTDQDSQTEETAYDLQSDEDVFNAIDNSVDEME